MQADQHARAERLERHAVDLALFLAEKVIGGAIAVQPEQVIEAVRGALRGIVERERITVLVHPEDLELVRDAMDGMRATLGGIEHCEVQAERRVSRGGAVVRTPDGDVDARVETKLAACPRGRRDRALDGIMSFGLEQATAALRDADLHRRHGRVIDLIGLIVEATGLEAEVGEVCTIETGRGRSAVPAEVVGFRAGRTLLMALGEATGIGPGARVSASGRSLRVDVSDDLLGRTLDGLGRPLDDFGPMAPGRSRAVEASPPDPLTRPRITERVSLGVRALDALVPCGRGQRLGIFAGSGVGKSSLLGMIARSTSADVNVICLVGERGREVREFIERDLGPEGMARSVVIVATSDQPALVRIKAAFTATTIAEHFRDQGRDVMLMMDSVTRFAMAQREVGLAIGEPPATRGYTPSVFALLPKLLERAGTSPRGTITGLYTVLVDGDDMNEPIADAVRSILDGHVVLSRDLAHAGHYPAIDVLASVSRLVGEVVTRRRALGGRRRPPPDGRLPRQVGPDRDRRLPAGQRPGDRRRDRGARADRRASCARSRTRSPPPRRPTRCSPSSRCSPACPSPRRRSRPSRRRSRRPPAPERRCTRRSRRYTSRERKRRA